MPQMAPMPWTLLVMLLLLTFLLFMGVIYFMPAGGVSGQRAFSQYSTKVWKW